ncbi:unnamed protein product, partial [Leptidea sinapis]
MLCLYIMNNFNLFQLLLECGLIRPTSAGLFTILPLARRAIDKLENLIHKCLEHVNAQRMSLPSLTSARLWERSGRLDQVGAELLMVQDRHNKQYLLAPTHEEAVTELMADVGPLSYKQLPLLIYQISNKYRDELRPKHGLLRAREFQMLDLYGVHADEASAASVYDDVTGVYRRLFDSLHLPVYRVSAPPGEMGGSVSHEWQLPAAAGEDTVAVCPSCSHVSLRGPCQRCGSETTTLNSIEVGHTFVLGTRYSECLQARCTPPDSNPTPLVMSCYGIGITRLLAGSIEHLSSETSIRWPAPIAPYTALVIGPKEGSKEWLSHNPERVRGVSQLITDALGDEEVIIDDRHHLTIGKRLMLADRMGYPYIIVCGRSSTDTPPKYELYRSNSGHEEPGPLLLELSPLLEHIKQSQPKLFNKCINSF